MNAVYWDTSALLKLYAPEADSSEYFRLLIAQPDSLAISFLHQVELWFALRGKECRGEIQPGSARSLFGTFETHIEQGRYLVIPWGKDVETAARDTLERSLSGAPPVPLRSLDGFHLGAAIAAGVSAIVTADIRMGEAAERLGLRIVS